MKKISAIILAVLLVFSLAGCGGEKKTAEKKEGKLDYANMSADDLLKDIKDKKNITADEFIKLVSTYSYVKITDEMQLEENITSEAIEKLTESGAKLPDAEEYAEKLLESKSPQVRAYAISKITDNENLKNAAKKLLKTETENYVLYTAIERFSGETSDGDVWQFLLDAAKCDSPAVRKRAVDAIASSKNKDLDGAVETVISLMDDSDASVRKAAYQYAGRFNDDRVIEPIVKMLNDESQAEFHGDGVKGLVAMWYDYPLYKNTNEAAYRATMDYLRTTPGSKNVPAWTAVASFMTVGKNAKNFDAWREKATYYNPDEIYEVMANIVKNENLDMNARISAVKVVSEHCSDEQLGALGGIVDALTDSVAANIKKVYESQMQNK